MSVLENIEGLLRFSEISPATRADLEAFKNQALKGVLANSDARYVTELHKRLIGDNARSASDIDPVRRTSSSRQEPRTIDELMAACENCIGEGQFEAVVSIAGRYVKRVANSHDYNEPEKLRRAAYGFYLMTKAMYRMLLASSIQEQQVLLDRFFRCQVPAYRYFDRLTRTAGDHGEPDRDAGSEHHAFLSHLWEMYEDVYDRFAASNPEEIELRVQEDYKQAEEGIRLSAIFDIE